jgi:hypothetical protein
MSIYIGQLRFYYRLYSDCREKALGAKARDTETAIKLWEVSAKIVGLADWDPFTADDKMPPSWAPRTV